MREGRLQMSLHVAARVVQRGEVVGDEMEPLRYALRFSPPALLLEYGNDAERTDPSTPERSDDAVTPGRRAESIASARKIESVIV